MSPETTQEDLVVGQDHAGAEGTGDELVAQELLRRAGPDPIAQEVERAAAAAARITDRPKYVSQASTGFEIDGAAAGC